MGDRIVRVHDYNVSVVLRSRKSSFYFIGFAYAYPARMYTAEESLTNPQGAEFFGFNELRNDRHLICGKLCTALKTYY